MNITNATTLDGFVASPDRQNYTQCPKSFPFLGSFEWDADHTKSLKCPSKREISFTCSAPFDVHITNNQGASSEGGVAALLVCIAALTCVLACIFRSRLNREGSNYQNTNDFSYSKAGGSTDESTEFLSVQRSDRDTVYNSFSSSEGIP